MHLPMPEFLSLTYTLPYHLIQQLERVAQETNRSQSEMIAESIRLYLKTAAARREHTRISTVEGFSYQQVAVGDATLEDHLPGNGASANGRPNESHASPAGAGDFDEEWDEEELYDEDEDDDGQWEDEDWEEEPDEESAETLDEQDTLIPEQAPDEPVRGEQARHAGARQIERLETEQPETDDHSTSAGGVSNSAGSGADTEAAVDDAPEAPEPAVDPAPAVALAADTQASAELDQIVDPAAEVRRRLRKISGEQLGSSAMRSALADIMQEIDVKDFSPNDHSQKVAGLARQLGLARGISGGALLQLELAALVHDIGKASVPSDILEKRRPAPEEMAVIRQYPEFGADLLEIVPAMEPLKQLVGSHQERWNGSGYPDGLQGDDIPVGAQIIALCDVYNVLTTERRYRPAYTEDRARQIIRQNVGALWNQDIARVFLRKVIGDEED